MQGFILPIQGIVYRWVKLTLRFITNVPMKRKTFLQILLQLNLTIAFTFIHFYILDHIIFYDELMNYFCGIGDRRKVLKPTSNRDHDQSFSPSQTCDNPQAGFQSAQNLSSDLMNEVVQMW